MPNITCVYCGDDIDAKGQDNMSYEIGSPMCEDCYNQQFNQDMQMSRNIWDNENYY